MDFLDTSGSSEFRQQVRDWLVTNKPAGTRPIDTAGARAFDLTWQKKQHDAGWAGIAWPREYGGKGLSPVQQLIWHEEYALADAPAPGCCFVGLNHAGPTLIERGTDSHKSRHLPLILRGEAVWCQGFSEPNAGSDLASLQTRGVIDGDALVVNGQKIWTSHAHMADYQELLVRTDPAARNHKGITWIICDMHLPGITVNPIRTMSGQDHFCQVFYDNVRIPLANVVGALNEGWSVAMATLGFERGTSFILEQVRLSHSFERLEEFARDHRHDRTSEQTEATAQRLRELKAEIIALRAMTYANVARIAKRGKPGPEGSLIRLYFSKTAKKLFRLGADILGPAAFDASASRFGWEYINSFRLSIAAGTSEIQRNIIGERLLGLPRGDRK